VRAAIVLALFAVFHVAPAPAAGNNDSAGAWQSLTRLDVEAAYTFLRENHPAALPEVGDGSFVLALAAARSKALSRIDSVSNLSGYTAVIAEFAHPMGDGHINSFMSVLPRSVEWHHCS
jgi:hypothetical protein